MDVVQEGNAEKPLLGNKMKHTYWRIDLATGGGLAVEQLGRPDDEGRTQRYKRGREKTIKTKREKDKSVEEAVEPSIELRHIDLAKTNPPMTMWRMHHFLAAK